MRSIPSKLRWTVSGTGVQTKGTVVPSTAFGPQFIYPGRLDRSKIRASVANTLTFSIFVLDLPAQFPPPADGAASNTIDQLSIVWTKTGIVAATGSTTVVCDATSISGGAAGANMNPSFQGGLYVFIDATIATGAWTLIGLLEIEGDMAY